MAKKDDPQPSRVYKASDVHKRRVGRKARSDETASSPAPAQPSSEGVVLTPEFGRRTERQKEADDRWFAALREDIPEIAPSSESQDAPSGNGATRDARGAENTPRDAAAHDAHGMDGAPRGAADNSGHGAEGKPGAGARRSPAGQDAPAGQPQTQPESALNSQPTVEIPPVSDKVADADAPKGDDPSEEPPEPSESKRRPSLAKAAARASVRKRVVIGVSIALVVLVAAAAALFTWNRWYRYDDHADMQGEWYIVGTAVPIAIDEASIHLTDDVTYAYEINPQDKTIRYTFGPMEGQGRYWFSDDRQYLVITDGDDFTGAGTAFDDLMRMFSDLPDKASGADLRLPEGEGIIAFSRTPDAAAVAKQEADAAAKAAAEEAARKEAERIAAEQAAAEAAEAEEYYYYYYDEGEYSEEESSGEGQAEGEWQLSEDEQPVEEGYGEEQGEG